MQATLNNPQKILQAISTDKLELIILPTEKCNFRCVYCYEDFSIGKMKPHIVNAVKNFILKRVQNNLKELHIQWFGGEPLLAQSVIFDVCHFVQELQCEYTQLNFSSSMTTNGYLLDSKVLSELIQRKVSHYQISLDGLTAEHDKTRIRADGLGTFDVIWSNLLAAKQSDHDFQITLRVHVTPENLVELPELIQAVKTSFGYDNRFKIFFKAIEDLGGTHSKTFAVLHKQSRQEILQVLYGLIGDAFKIDKIEPNNPYICYAAHANSFVIRAQGRIGKCTVALDDERNDIGYLAPDGMIKIDNDKLAPWLRGLSSLVLGDLACPMSNLHQHLASLGKHQIAIKVVK